MAASAVLDFWNFKFFTIGTVKKVELCQRRQRANFRRNRSNRGRYMWVSILCYFTWKCLFTPLFGGFGAHFSQMMSPIVLTPKRTVLGLNHVVWAIKREYRSRGSSWAFEREKKDRTGQEKITKGLYFTFLWRSPHWSDAHENLFSMLCSRRNHVCKFQNEIFRGYDFTGSRILHFPIDFLMGLATAQRYCAACDCNQSSTVWTSSGNWLGLESGADLIALRNDPSLSKMTHPCVVAWRSGSVVGLDQRS